MPTATNTVTPQELARVFSRRLVETIGEDNRQAVVELNAQDNPSICHSHDYCDALQVMIDACDELGIPTDDVTSEAFAALTDEAWSIAKAAEFRQPAQATIGHTPGPYHRAGLLICANTPRGQAEIASVHDSSEYVLRLEAEANANLFTAAPELLAACKSLLARFEKSKRDYMPRPLDQDEWIDRLQSLIAKATP